MFVAGALYYILLKVLTPHKVHLFGRQNFRLGMFMFIIMFSQPARIAIRITLFFKRKGNSKENYLPSASTYLNKRSKTLCKSNLPVAEKPTIVKTVTV